MNTKRIILRTIPIVLALLLANVTAHAQVNSGSDGHDGAFNPTTNTVINMADHPDGIYHYTSVNIPTNVTVTFIPNANNTPVVWLVQSNVLINGVVDLSGASGANGSGGIGGPGGFRGGTAQSLSGFGQGLGGGPLGPDGGNASYGGRGGTNFGTLPGNVYGTIYLLPLVGGSGGGGATNQQFGQQFGGGGGGGAMLIAAGRTITLNNAIIANGGRGQYGYYSQPSGGGGSGGAIRLYASRIDGTGDIQTVGGRCGGGWVGGFGRIRLDAFENLFGGRLTDAAATQGFQPIIIATPGVGTQLTITSVGGVLVSALPSGQFATPDAVLAAQQNNPIPIVVHCSNIPLNTQITVSVKPANGAAVSAMGLNNSGTLASSTATVLLNMPRGGGLIYATAATGN